MRSHPEERINQHPFLDFFRKRIGAFKSIFEVNGLPKGLMHCDAFLDNMLMLSDGSMSGLIDWEDAAMGPLVHDLGIAVIGGCYDACTNKLDMDRLRPFLKGYTSLRPLSEAERSMLVPCMKKWPDNAIYRGFSPQNGQEIPNND